MSGPNRQRPLLSVSGLCVDYGTPSGLSRVVHEVSFDIAAGEALGIAGESGSGKSTVAFAVARLHRPPAFVTGGNIVLDGMPVLTLRGEALRAWRWRDVSVVLQSAMNALNPVLSIAAQFQDIFAAHGLTPAAGAFGKRMSRERAAELLTLVGISPDRLGAYPHQLSGGMRQRVSIAMALALRPKLVVMDEPTTALDVVVQREILDTVKALRQQLGFALLFISHDLALMDRICDRTGIMLQGRLVEIGPTREVLTTPKHDYTARLVASVLPLHPAEPHRNGWVA